jgi:hypothetical protein
MPNGSVPDLMAEYPAEIAPPHQSKLTGIKKASAPVSRTPGRGCPLHNTRSSGPSSP